MGQVCCHPPHGVRGVTLDGQVEVSEPLYTSSTSSLSRKFQSTLERVDEDIREDDRTTASGPASPGEGDDEQADIEALFLETKASIEADTVNPDSMSDWKDISKPTARVHYKTKSAPARDCVCMLIETRDQVKTFPLLQMEQGQIKSGVIPTFWSVRYWPLWFPFCTSVELLKQYSPSNFIIHVKLTILFFVVDFIVYCGIKNNLDHNGTIEVIIKSPPPGSEGTQWFGIEVPALSGRLPRVCMECGLLIFKPKTLTEIWVKMHMELRETPAPNWVKVFAFQQLAIRILPELVKFQEKLPRTALGKYLGSGMELESRDWLINLHNSIREYVAREKDASVT